MTRMRRGEQGRKRGEIGGSRQRKKGGGNSRGDVGNRREEHVEDGSENRGIKKPYV